VLNSVKLSESKLNCELYIAVSMAIKINIKHKPLSVFEKLDIIKVDDQPHVTHMEAANNLAYQCRH
jgi:hypothetical protein